MSLTLPGLEPRVRPQKALFDAGLHLDEEPEGLSCIAKEPQRYHTIYIRLLPADILDA